MNNILKYFLVFIIALLIPTWLIIHFVPSFALVVIGSALLAYIFDPIANRLDKWGIGRSFSAFMLTFVLPSVLVVLFIRIVPGVIENLMLVIDAFPTAFNQQIAPLLKTKFDYDIAWQDLNPHLIALQQLFSWQLVGKSLGGFSLLLLNTLLFMVIAFILLRDWKTIVIATREVLHELTPDSWNAEIDHLFRQIGGSISRLIRGQLQVSTLLAIYYGLAFHVIGLLAEGEFHLVSPWMLLGVVTGYLNVLPYIGVPVGGVIACILGLMTYQFEVLWIYLAIPLVVILGTLVDHKMLTPVIIGRSLKVYELFVYLAIYLGVAVGGLVGIILALPATAIVSEITRHFYRHWQLHRDEERSSPCQ
jgi:predicted PurR-regulated permease PerM